MDYCETNPVLSMEPEYTPNYTMLYSDSLMDFLFDYIFSFSFGEEEGWKTDFLNTKVEFWLQ